MEGLWGAGWASGLLTALLFVEEPWRCFGDERQPWWTGSFTVPRAKDFAETATGRITIKCSSDYDRPLPSSFDMTSPPVRVLVLGSAKGNLKDAFNKLSSLNAKAGPFDVVLCLGDLFGDEDEYFQQLISGEVEIPVSTYFTIGRRALPETVKMLVGHGGQVCENLFFLGNPCT